MVLCIVCGVISFKLKSIAHLNLCCEYVAPMVVFGYLVHRLRRGSPQIQFLRYMGLFPKYARIASAAFICQSLTNQRALFPYFFQSVGCTNSCNQKLLLTRTTFVCFCRCHSHWFHNRIVLQTLDYKCDNAAYNVANFRRSTRNI